MSATVRSAAGAATTSASASPYTYSFSETAGAPQAGDTRYVFIFTPTSITVPTGWTAIYNGAGNVAGTRSLVIMSRAWAAGQGTTTITFGAYAYIDVAIVSVTGGDPNNAPQVSVNSTGATTGATATVPGLTPTTADQLELVYTVFGTNAAATVSAPSGTTTALNDTSSTSYNSVVGRAAVTSTAAIGTSTTTSSVAGPWASAMVLIPSAVASVALSTLVDTFSGTTLSTEWTANGAGVQGNGAYINVSQNAGAAVYSSLRSQPNKQWAGYSIAFEIGSMPGNAGTTSAAGDSANAQFWIRDPNPAATVDRLGAEYVASNNTLVLRGQTGNSYAAIGADVTLNFDPIAHRWLRLDQTTSGTVVWSTSPDGLAWTTQRTLTGAPTWTTKTTLQVSIEGFRTTGTNDTIRVDNINNLPSALPTSAPSGADALQTRTLNEVRAWEQWLSTNSARGFVGELGWVTHFSGWGDTTQGAQWSGLGNVYLVEADYAGLSTSVWGAGRNWGNGYPLGTVYGVNAGDPLTLAATDASPVGQHHTKGAGAAVRWRASGLSGYERGMTITGGGTVRSATPYVHNQADFYFLAACGVDTVRLAFAWERLQPTIGAALSTSALADIDGMLIAARQAGIRVILDLHNYGRYTAADGTTVTSVAGGGISDAQFSQFWTLLSTWVTANPTRSGTVIAYGLMNEPHDLPNGATGWQSTSQAVLTAIRNAGDNRLIMVAGYQFASLTSWSKNHPSGWITDSAGNFMYEAHHYWDTASVLGSRSGTYQQSNGSGGQQTETYQTEYATTQQQTSTDGPTGAEQGSPAEVAVAPPYGPTDRPTGAEQGSGRETIVGNTVVGDRPTGAEQSAQTDVAGASTTAVDGPTGAEQSSQRESQALGSVVVDRPTGAEQGTPRDGVAGSSVTTDRPTGAEASSQRETQIPGTVFIDTATGAEQSAPADRAGGSAVINEAPSVTEEAAPAEVSLPLPPTLTEGQVGPTELDLTVQLAPQVSEAALRLYGWLGAAFIEGDDTSGYPLLRFCEAPGRLLQDIEDITRDENATPGWSAVFDLTRAPTHVLPWLGQTVGVDVDPTIPDAAQRAQIVNESSYARGTVQALRAVALSWLQGPNPVVDIVERDGNRWTVTVAVYAAQLVGKTYAALSMQYPTYVALSGQYPAYQNFAVGYSELFAALQQVKPAGLILNLVVRTGPSYAALTARYAAYTNFANAYPTYSSAIGAQPVTS